MSCATPIRRVCPLEFFRRRSLLASVLTTLAITLSCAFSLQAADNITAHVDAKGRVIFVNEGDSPTAAAPTGRRLVASTDSADAASEPSASLAPPAEPIFEEPVSDARVTAPRQIDALIEQAATRHQIDPDLVRAIIRVESNFDPYAVSPAGARGLMQLIPGTARRFGVENPFDPQSNLDGGIRYLKHLLGMYQGDLQLSLAAYNAGEQAVARFGGVPRYRETQNYIRKIAELYPLRPIPAGIPAEPVIEKFVDGQGTVHFSNIDRP